MTISAIEFEIPRARSVRVTSDTLHVDVSDGRTISVPVGWYPRLAHATAEERHLYVPLLMNDAGLTVSRHALADHHKAEKLVEELRGVDPTTDHFAELARQLAHEVRDHLDEEENGTFQLAGKLLSKTRQKELAGAYRAEYARRGGPASV